MRWTWPTSWVWGGVLLLAVLAPTGARADWVSPGPLSRAHSDLDRESKCEQCHLRGRGVSRDRCLACHTRVALPLSRGKGFHAKQIEASGKPCEGCHHEHKGRKYPLIRWSPPAGFDHGAETGHALEEAHARLSCQRCHKRRPAYMGASTRCAGCHEDPHRKALGTFCDRCHGQTAFSPTVGFDHGRTDFPLQGEHAKTACAKCHGPALARQTPRTCNACRKDRHAGRFGDQCQKCHSPRG